MDFIKGMDVSFLPEEIDGGMVIKDLEGRQTDAFALMKKHGVNSVRLRIWNNPENSEGARGYCSLGHTLQMAGKIKENGMHFLLDFHYSDWWADPAKQSKPAAWEGLHGKELEEAVYEYTKSVLFTLKGKGLLPDAVQIGNEIRSGLLFPDGELPDVKGMVGLVNAGIRAAREVADASVMQVMIHLDQGGRYEYLHDWFENAIHAGLSDFDLIGLSYYPFWHGNFYDLKTTCEKLLADYKKPIAVVETAHPWKICEKGFVNKEQAALARIEASEEGQLKELLFVMDIMSSLPEKKGLGIYYWEPLCIPMGEEGGWGENMSLLKEDGQVMKGIKAFEYERREFSKEEQEMLELLKEESEDEGDEEVRDFQDGVNLLNNTVRFEGKSNFIFGLSQMVNITEKGIYCVEAEYKGTDTTNVDIRLYVSRQPDGKKEELSIHPTQHRYSLYRLENVDLKPGRVAVGVDVVSSPAWGKVKSVRMYKTS